MFSKPKNESFSPNKLNMTQNLLKKKIVSNDKVLANNNLENILDKFNSSCSLRISNYQKVPYVRQINKKTLSIFNTDKNLTRNRNTSTTRENYNNRPNTILNLSKNQKNSNLNKKNKLASAENNNKKVLVNSDVNTEVPLIKIKKKIADSNSMRINKNLNSKNSQQQKFQKKIYSLKNNIVYNKTGNNIGLNSNFICNPFFSKNKEILKKSDNKLTERQRIKVNLNIKENPPKTRPNFKANETEQNLNRSKNSQISNFEQNIYVNTINNKIDIINNINIDSINGDQNNKISEENRINKLNKNKIVDILNGKIIANSFQKKSRNLNYSNETYTNEFCPDSSDNKTSLYRLNLNTNETTNKLLNFYNSVDNPKIKMTYHKKTTKQLIRKKTQGGFKNKINNFSTTKRKNIMSNTSTIGNTTINNSSKNYIFESKNNNNVTIDSYKKNINLNNSANRNFNGIVRTKYSNVYLRKKSGREADGHLKNVAFNINKKVSIGNTGYKNSKGELYQGSFLKTSKLIIKK